MNRQIHSGSPAFWTTVAAFVFVLSLGTSATLLGASFPGNARLEINDSTGGLSWVPANNALSIQAWFKISIPSSTNITEDMTILVNRKSGATNDTHAYHLFYNINSGNIEFSTRGSGGPFSTTVIERPYLDRWYHVAVVRQAEVFNAYVDGRQVVRDQSAAVGNASSNDGVSIGGWTNARHFFGEVQEVSIYQTALSQDFIVQNMFTNQPAISQLKGYFKLGFSPNTSDNLKNFAPLPVPTSTDLAVKQGTGVVEFEETNQAGEQSYFDAQRNGARGYIVPLSGAFSHNQTALSRPTPGVSFELRFSYSSASSFGGFKLGGNDPYAAGPMGRGWRHIFETRVIPAQAFSPLSDTDTLGLLSWDGSIETWDRNPATFLYRTRSGQYRGELSLTPTNCLWTTPERLVYVFRRPDSGPAVMRGKLLSIRDFNNNSVQINYNEILGEITNVIDTVGGRYEFAHTNGLLRKVTFGDWSINLSYDDTNRLVSFARTNSSGIYVPVNTTWQYAYNSTNNLLERITDPRGSTNVFVHYDKYGRKTNIVDALGRSTRTEYGTPGKRQIKTIDPENQSSIETFDRKHRLLTRRDPLGNETQFTYDEAGNPTSITEPLGWKTLMAYDDRANLIATTNALGEVSRRVIHTNSIPGQPHFNKGVEEIDPLGWTNVIVIENTTGNLLSNHDALGSLSRYTYGANGLVLTAEDGNGKINRLAYDTNGFVIARTDAAGFTTTFGNNELGWKLTETNVIGQVTTYTYDINGQVVRVVDPLNRILTSTYDPNGNVIEQSDAKGQITRHSYDAANQRTQTVDRAGFTRRFTYTKRGQPLTTIDPAGFASTNFYDEANRLVATSDPLGNTVSNIYNANGKIIATIDHVGQRWTKTYDSLGRVIAETDPQGDTRRTTYDAANRVKQITTAKGSPSTHEYDGRARLTRWVDPEGFVWRYAYDGTQNITNITDALNGHYVMTYGPRNERLLERNQDGFEWRYEFDELLRLKRQTDPNGVRRTIKYDAGGRSESVTFSTGRIDAFVYDDNNNPEVVTRTGSGPPTIIQFKYDELDRVIETTDAFGKKVKFGYDSRGLRERLTYPDGKVLTNRFDPIGRLTNQIDWAGRQMNYAFDKAGRLIRRSYPNGIVQTNTFDSSGQLTGLSYQAVGLPNPAPSNAVNIALSYAYDRNGNKASWTEKGTLQWPLPSLTDEKARYTASNRLIDRLVQPLAADNAPQNIPATVDYRYDASGNMTNAVGGGQSWTLDYDEDNRVTSVFWKALPLTEKLIVNRYDALGRRVACTVDGIETRYVLDLAGGMERTLCDTSGSGVITTWYVHGPDLAYKVDSTANLTCFHADAQANIIALSGAGGTNTAQYAYTPYGRLVGSASSQAQVSNPYLFVGSQGVMEELPGLYFMRARYYSAEAAVFLSTDPVKKIGPGWKPEAYSYVSGNPLSRTDPTGLVIRFADDQASEAFSEAVSEIWSTPPGRKLITSLMDSQRDFLMATDSIKGLPGNQLGFFVSRGFDPGMFTDAGIQRATMTRIVAHEMAHLRDGASLNVIQDEMAAINVENEIMGYFGGSKRLSHEAASAPSAGWSSEAYSRAPPANTSALQTGGLNGQKFTARASRTSSAGVYANMRNSLQGTVGKFASGSISLAAPFIGGLAADAFGRILPKSTPPVIREAAKLGVSLAVTSVVKAAAPVIGAAVGAVAGVVVGAAVAAAHAVGGTVVAIVVAVGVPKEVYLILVFIVASALGHYYRQQRWRRIQLLKSDGGIFH